MNSKTYRNIFNEGDEGYVPESCYMQDIEEEKKRFLEEWTLETTQKRRKLWNDWVIEYKNAGVTAITAGVVAYKQKELKFTLSDLKKAIELHGLK